MPYQIKPQFQLTEPQLQELNDLVKEVITYMTLPCALPQVASSQNFDVVGEWEDWGISIMIKCWRP